jgi:hypothetical protein
MTKEEAALARKIGRALQKLSRGFSRGPIVGGLIDDRCHCQCGATKRSIPE